MKFAIQVNSGPYHDQSSTTAYQFIKAALNMGHQVVRVFFYHDGSYHGLVNGSPSEAEWSPVRRWSQLADEFQLDMVICISAAQRRGLRVTENSMDISKNEHESATGFHIGGLGLWVDACLRADRFLVF